jgi:hypothetical protein
LSSVLPGKPVVEFNMWAPGKPPPKRPLWAMHHDAAESVEKRIVWESPPQSPPAPLKETAKRLSVTPLATVSQTAPPSVVLRINPWSPTATASPGSKQ